MPACFVIFGITGDLAQKKLLPALFQLYKHGKLPNKFKVVGYSRRQIRRREFVAYLKKSLKNVGKIAPKDFSNFASHIIYIQGHFEPLGDYKRLGSTLSSIDEIEFKECSNKLFYLAVPPKWYGLIATNLSNSGLTIPCGGKDGWTRVLIEKPFGKDIETSRKLNLLLGKLFKEEQIYRIDHYLGKEASSKILDFRFKKGKWEKYWNDKYIKQIEVRLLESKDINHRGAFYDQIGALRDVGQNHLLQMLALTVMEKPQTYQPNEIRKLRAAVLKKVKKPSKIIRAQYQGYLKEKGVSPRSQTETYFRLETKLDFPRWRKTKVILESGKALSESQVEVRVIFKNKLKPVVFDYTKIRTQSADAYEKVLLDCVLGDQTIFNSTEEVEAAWCFITPILRNQKKFDLKSYSKGENASIIAERG